MKPNGVFFNVVVAAVVAAVTAVGTSYLVLRYAPLGSKSADRARVEQIMRDYLTNNPEILVEMTNELDKRQAAEQSVQQQEAISQNADAIFRSPVSHVAGNPNGDVSVVEFFDYNCPYCRRSLPVVLKLINEDAKVRLVLKELPILSDDSVAAAKLALAANKQGKYFEMHQKLFAEPGKADKEKALRVAKEFVRSYQDISPMGAPTEADAATLAGILIGTRGHAVVLHQPPRRLRASLALLLIACSDSSKCMLSTDAPENPAPQNQP